MILTGGVILPQGNIRCHEELFSERIPKKKNILLIKNIIEYILSMEGKIGMRTRLSWDVPSKRLCVSIDPFISAVGRNSHDRVLGHTGVSIDWFTGVVSHPFAFFHPTE